MKTCCSERTKENKHKGIEHVCCAVRKASHDLREVPQLTGEPHRDRQYKYQPSSGQCSSFGKPDQGPTQAEAGTVPSVEGHRERVEEMLCSASPSSLFSRCAHVPHLQRPGLYGSLKQLRGPGSSQTARCPMSEAASCVS